MGTLRLQLLKCGTGSLSHLHFWKSAKRERFTQSHVIDIIWSRADWSWSISWKNWMDPTSPMVFDSSIMLQWNSGRWSHELDTTRSVRTKTRYLMYEHYGRFLSNSIWRCMEHTRYAGRAKMFFRTRSSRQFLSWYGSPCSHVRGMKNRNRLSQWSFIISKRIVLEESLLASTTVLGNLLNIFRFDPLYKLHLGIPKLQKECTLKFLGSDKAMTKPSGAER